MLRAILPVLLIASCAPATISENEVSSPEARPAAKDEIALSGNRFGVDLYRQLGSQSGNLMISPVSLYGAFGPVTAGARGETREAIVQALRLPTGEPSLHPALGGLLRDLERNEEGTTLRIANALWVQQGFALNPAFAATARNDYRAAAEQVDFQRAPDDAVARINGWVSERTATRIPTLISRDAINDATRLVVTNAVYFLGDWAKPFNASSTNDQPFYLLGGSSRTVALMAQKDRFRYFETDDFQAIDLPYKNERLSMTVLLPKRRGALRTLEAQLSDARLAEWLGRLDAAEPQTVRLHLPKFRMSADYDLEQPLTGLGMGPAFSSQADLRGIADADLRIAKVVHKTFLQVDEKGTEAAAATGVMVETVSAPLVQPPVFRADHPFIVLIRDHRTGVILFLGRIEDPQPL